MPTNRCPLCLSPTVNLGELLAGDNWRHFTCSRCGRFDLDFRVWEAVDDDRHGSLLGPSNGRPRANASAYVREHQGTRIGSDEVHWLATLRAPTFHVRANKVLQAIEQRTEAAGQDVPINGPDWVATAWCLHEGELAEVVRFLKESKRVRCRFPDKLGPVAIEPEGWAHLEQIRERGAATAQGFIAMRMDPSLQPSLDPLRHEGLEAGIRAAGYEPLRIDQKLDADHVDDEIVAEIKRSRFVVVDFTNHRPSVYLEAGLAMGLNTPVVRTCLADDMKYLAFDQRTYHCLEWRVGSESELAKPLSARIVAKAGWGPLAHSIEG